MVHTNPNFYAQTLCPQEACPPRAGHLLAWYGVASLSTAERLQLSESARFSMDEEIVMLRKMMKNFVCAASMSEEDSYPDNLAKALDLLGLTCSRLASVLRVNMSLNGSQEDAWRQQIEESLATFIREEQAQRQDA